MIYGIIITYHKRRRRKMDRNNMDTNKLSFESVLSVAVKIPGVKINRDEFLKSELKKYCADSIVDKAISNTPLQAGIEKKIIDRIAKNCINYEATKVTAISAVAGIPGGFAMFGTIPADLAQYVGHVLRVMQKTIYLYGWESLFNDNGELDDETKSILTVLFGVMFGVQTATGLLNKILPNLSNAVEKKLLATALTKTTIYPIVKKIAKAIGLKMTREVFAKGVAKTVPIIGAVVNGGLTFISFKPMANKFRKYIADLSQNQDSVDSGRIIIEDYEETV